MPEENTSIIVGIVAGTIIFLLLGWFIVSFLFLFQRKQEKNRVEKQELKNQFAQTLLQSQLEIKEQTLTYIAAEIHDNFGQIASLIKINLHTINLSDNIKATGKIEDTKELVRQLILDLKSLSLNLNGDRIVHLGIVKAIESEVEKLNRTGQFEATFTMDSKIQPLDPNTTIIVYRMIQEIINNIVKHSSAKSVRISASASEKLFTLAISDDGVGFNLEEKTLSGGSGLLNLQSRAKLIRAQFSVKSTEGKGTRIVIELPYPDQ